MGARFTSRNWHGFVWLCFEGNGRIVWLHRQCRIGERYRPGQRSLDA